MKKRLLCMLLAVLLVVLLPTATLATGEVNFTLGTASGKAGTTVLVPLSMTSTTNINTIGVSSFTYDTSVLTFNGFVNNGELVSGAALPSLDDTKATIVLGYLNPSTLSGNICSLSFTIAANAEPGDYPITYSTLVKHDSTEYSASATPGKVTVSGASAEDACTLELSLKTTAGQTISKVPTSGPFWACVDIVKNAQADCGILLATYSVDNQFLGLLHANLRRLDVGQSVGFDFYVKNEQNNIAKVKVFAISSLSDLQPLGEAKSVSR